MTRSPNGASPESLGVSQEVSKSASLDIEREELLKIARECQSLALSNFSDLRDIGRSRFQGTFTPKVVIALLEQNATLKSERDEARERADDLRDRLHDLVMIDSEEWAVGGGPGFKDRRDRAWANAREIFEP